VIGQTTSDEWSAVKDGVQGRLIFSEEPAFNGTRMLGIDLELRNVSDVGNPIEIYYDPINAFRCELLDAKNNPVAQPPLVADIMTPNPYWISLPYQGSIRFRVSVNGYGVAKDSGRMIQMSCGAWLLKPGDQAPYAFHATLSADPAREPRPHAWKGPLELPLTAVPR
jgi:hypothetical protein